MLKERSRVVHQAGSGLPIWDFSPQHVENQGLQGAIRFHVHVDIRDPGQCSRGIPGLGKSLRMWNSSMWNARSLSVEFPIRQAMEATDRGLSATSSVARSRPEYHGSSGSSITWFSGVL